MILEDDIKHRRRAAAQINVEIALRNIAAIAAVPLRPEWAARLAERSLMLFDLIEPVLGDKSRTRLQADRKTMVDLQRRAASA